MKKCLIAPIALFVISLFPLSGLFSARYFAEAGETRYSRVLSENVILYMDSSLTVPWFVLPYGYYVKVLSINGVSAKVEYRGDTPAKPSAKGYVATDELHIVEEVPQVVYPALTLTVNQTCMLYKDTDFTITETITQNSTVDYYGILAKPDGEKYVFGLVSTTSGDKYLGYISINSVFSFAIPRLEPEEESIDESAGETTSGQSETTSSSLGNGVQLAVIIAVSAVAISIVYLLFRPSGKGSAKDEAITGNEFDDDY